MYSIDPAEDEVLRGPRWGSGAGEGGGSQNWKPCTPLNQAALFDTVALATKCGDNAVRWHPTSVTKTFYAFGCSYCETKLNGLGGGSWSPQEAKWPPTKCLQVKKLNFYSATSPENGQSQQVFFIWNTKKKHLKRIEILAPFFHCDVI